MDTMEDQERPFKGGTLVRDDQFLFGQPQISFGGCPADGFYSCLRSIQSAWSLNTPKQV